MRRFFGADAQTNENLGGTRRVTGGVAIASTVLRAFRANLELYVTEETSVHSSSSSTSKTRDERDVPLERVYRVGTLSESVDASYRLSRERSRTRSLEERPDFNALARVPP